jgi:hypothetical protein
VSLDTLLIIIMIIIIIGKGKAITVQALRVPGFKTIGT